MKPVIKVIEKTQWIEIDTVGNLYCPECNILMFISPIDSVPTYAFCADCKKYFMEKSILKSFA